MTIFVLNNQILFLMSNLIYKITSLIQYIKYFYILNLFDFYHNNSQTNLVLLNLYKSYVIKDV